MAIGTFNYPSTLGKEVAAGQHYMMIDSYESKNAVQGHTNIISSIALYIPPNALTTTIAQSYGEMAGGAVMASVGGAGEQDRGQTLTASLAQKYQKATTEGAWEAIKGAAGSILTKPQQAQNFMAAGLGMARNKHMALAYKGPSAFRTHTFEFNFFPKDLAESNMVRKIINDLKNGSTARLSGDSDEFGLSSPFFNSPRHYRIKFMMGGGNKQNPYLYQIGTSVITTMTINHDPQSVVGFHKDGSPVQTRLGLTFQEIEYITSADKLDGKTMGEIDESNFNSHDKQIEKRRGGR